MQFKHGWQEWRTGLTKIANETAGIERVAGVSLYVLTLISLTQWLHLAYEARNKSSLIDAYVVGVLVLSFCIFWNPNVCLAILSTYFSISTVIVLLNIVLLQHVFGEIPSPERSLLLFICNVAQIVFMFATWYRLGGEHDPLLKSVLAFATIGYSEAMPGLAMVQIATDFVLLAIFLSHLVGQFGARRAAAPNAEGGTTAR